MGNKKVDLIQCTPKREKGYQTEPKPISVVPLSRKETAIAARTEAIAVFKRLQFTSSTSSAAKKRAISHQHFSLVIELIAITECGDSVLIASIESFPLTVRSRSSIHYDETETPVTFSGVRKFECYSPNSSSYKDRFKFQPSPIVTELFNFDQSSEGDETFRAQSTNTNNEQLQYYQSPQGTDALRFNLEPPVPQHYQSSPSGNELYQYQSPMGADQFRYTALSGAIDFDRPMDQYRPSIEISSYLFPSPSGTDGHFPTPDGTEPYHPSPIGTYPSVSQYSSQFGFEMMNLTGRTTDMGAFRPNPMYQTLGNVEAVPFNSYVDPDTRMLEFFKGDGVVEPLSMMFSDNVDKAS